MLIFFSVYGDMTGRAVCPLDDKILSTLFENNRMLNCLQT